MKPKKKTKKKYTAPVKVGDEITVTIQNLGSKGDGITRHKEFVIIVPNTQIEQQHKIKIIKVFEKYAFGEVI